MRFTVLTAGMHSGQADTGFGCTLNGTQIAVQPRNVRRSVRR